MNRPRRAHACAVAARAWGGRRVWKRRSGASVPRWRWPGWAGGRRKLVRTGSLGDAPSCCAVCLAGRSRRSQWRGRWHRQPNLQQKLRERRRARRRSSSRTQLHRRVQLSSAPGTMWMAMVKHARGAWWGARATVDGRLVPMDSSGAVCSPC